MLKDDCFEDMTKPRVDVENDTRTEIIMMAEVVNLAVDTARLNLKDIRLPTPSLKQKHTLSSIIALRGDGVPINHYLTLEEFVKKATRSFASNTKKEDQMRSFFQYSGEYYQE
jgi:hypothetical protein